MTWRRSTRSMGHEGAVYALGATGERNVLLSGGGDGRIIRWDLARPDEGVLVAHCERAIFSLLHADERQLLFGDEDGGLHHVDRTERVERKLARAHTKGIFRLLPLPGGRVACAGGDGALSIWSFGDGLLSGPHRTIPLSDGKLRDMALSPDGTWLAVACGDGTLRILDTADLNEAHTFAGHGQGASAVCWHPHKPVLISGGKDGMLCFWHVAAEDPALMRIQAHTGTIYAIAFSADGDRCATASRDRSVKLWDPGSFEAVARLDGARSVNALLWSHRTLLTAGDDRSVSAWEETPGPA